jgi:DNA-dependent protein kinase catalytic subunit
VHDGAKKESSELLAWDPEARVKLKIPFQEMKTEIQFGKGSTLVAFVISHRVSL